TRSATVRWGATASAMGTSSQSAQAISAFADAREPRPGDDQTMLQLSLGQSLVMISTAGAAWLVVRGGVAKKMGELRVPRRCAACGGRLTGKTCSCAEGE